jgi:hypothetical protein
MLHTHLRDRPDVAKYDYWFQWSDNCAEQVGQLIVFACLLPLPLFAIHSTICNDIFNHFTQSLVQER